VEQLGIFVFLIVLGYITGTLAEKSHYRSIEKREREFLGLPAMTTGKSMQGSNVERIELVTGSVVISLDYFKRFLAALRNIFGGAVSSYETLIDRARREAILRMKEKAQGADLILNLRIETSSIGQNANRRKTIGSIEALAYGTAVTLRKN